MKKLSLILSMVVSIVLVGCGTEPQHQEMSQEEVMTTEAPTTEATADDYSKYKELFNMLESDDYDGAVKYIDELRPEPAVVIIDLTPDNILDYYDIGLVLKDYRDLDAYGSVKKLRYVTDYRIQLKDEIKEQLVEEPDWSLSVGVEYDYAIFPAYIKDIDGEVVVDYDKYEDISTITKNEIYNIEDYRQHKSKTVTSGQHGTPDSLGILSPMEYDPNKVLTEIGGNYFCVSAEDYTEETFYFLLPYNLKIITANGSLKLIK
ncbi:hypothetical protein [Butyrivibrio sp. YAB3001]|uniref:hypothetical protein n=1 Tax=Butyrivibrio sp. YAB3001 TaxID=1520812 RepID=UPI0008F668DC|nr:hypothetical protein [Butyrivibrio sp. YAB3001]SFC34435.1 hypothetical protein SAMN02910398_02042 [Butyrivibrio sp. YAB3001]